MLNGKHISSKQIILEVLEDNDFQSKDYTVDVVLRWIADALDLIGCVYTLVDNIALIKIEHNRGVLPCNLHSVKQVFGVLKNTDSCFPMRESTNTFHPYNLKNVNYYYQLDGNEPFKLNSNGEIVFTINGKSETITAPDTANNQIYTYADATYKINDNYIFTNFVDVADVLMSYRSFPIDSEGYPLIPDDIKFKEAVKAYVRMKIDYKNWRKGKVGADVYAYSEREWMWYCGAATTKGNIPTLGMMETWKNELTRLNPRLTEYSKAFNELGNQELYTGGNRLSRY